MVVNNEVIVYDNVYSVHRNARRISTVAHVPIAVY